MSSTIEQLSPSTTDPTATAGRRSWQATCLAVGGVVFAVGNALHPLQHNDAAYHLARWQAAHLVIFASLPLLVLGLPALHRRLRDRVDPWLALIPVVATAIGLIGIAPGAIIETFVAPQIGHAAMEHLEGGGMGIVDAIFGIAYIGGALGLGWAAWRSRLRPLVAGPAIIVAAVTLVAVMPLTSAAGGAAVIAATIAYGLALAALAMAR